jgi:hypothetical protein
MTDHAGRFINGLAILVLVAWVAMVCYVLFVAVPVAGVGIVGLLVVSYSIGIISERIGVTP